MAIELPLLETLSNRMNCEYLSDLRFLSGWQRLRLAREIEKIPCGAATLREWNDALEYLTGSASEQTAEAARQQLQVLIRQKKELKEYDKNRID